MNLKYRGVSYEYTPPTIATTPSTTVGKYRGLEWRFRNPTKTPVLQPSLDLVYRGVHYRTGQTTAVPSTDATANETAVAQAPAVPQAEMATAKSASVSVKDRARQLMTAHHGLIKKREQSLLGRIAAEVGLASDASEYWHPIQGKIGSGFRRTYDRSHVAMS